MRSTVIKYWVISERRFRGRGLERKKERKLRSRIHIMEYWWGGGQIEYLKFACVCVCVWGGGGGRTV